MGKKVKGDGTLKEANIVTARLDYKIIHRIDQEVQTGLYKNRSEGIKEALNFYFSVKDDRENGFFFLKIPPGIVNIAEELLTDYGRFSNLQSLFESVLNLGIRGMERSIREDEEGRKRRGEAMLERKMIREKLKE